MALPGVGGGGGTRGNGMEQEGGMHNRWTITQGSVEWGRGS